MNGTIVEVKYRLGSVIKFNKVDHRVNAFRYEVRPMGTFRVYELTNEETGKSVDTTEEVLDVDNNV